MTIINDEELQEIQNIINEAEVPKNNRVWIDKDGVVHYELP